MGEDVDWHDYTRSQMSNVDDAVEILGRCLRNGELLLLLGSGVSAPVGLPDWGSLVASCFELEGMTQPDGLEKAHPRELMRLIDTVRRNVERRGDDFSELVRRALYEGRVDPSGTGFDKSLARGEMLGALGALVMASARGSAGEVVTLNFDDLLEWFLDLHGFSTQVVTDLPDLLQSVKDVHVFHIHGFLPLDDERRDRSDWIIFGEKQFRDRISERGSDAWPAFFSSRLHSKVILAIGTSMSDDDLGVSMKLAADTIGDARPLGFVLCDRAKDMGDELAERGFVAVEFDDVKADAPDFLLRICQSAALMA